MYKYDFELDSDGSMLRILRLGFPQAEAVYNPGEYVPQVFPCPQLREQESVTVLSK